MAMEKHTVSIKSIENVTHDTLKIHTEKPANYTFKPGQATEIAINKNGWQNERRPFTFTSLPEDKDLQFVIKTYPEHDGATDKLLDLVPGDELILHEVFGSITYHGQGVFIAGGAGVTPFLAIFRDLYRKDSSDSNTLIFANKTRDDIILKEELEQMLDGQVVHILSEEKTDEYAHGFITREFLEQHINDKGQYFYICGPEPMMEAVEKHLDKLGIPKENRVKESW